MRDIKFRAWVSYENRMIYAYESAMKHGDLYEMRADGCSIEYLDDKGDTAITSGGFTLMQYTGLKDKNGVEIYEGDIIRDHRGSISAVTFELGGFRTNPVMPLWNKQCEVIGNIYEHPELLEPAS